MKKKQQIKTLCDTDFYKQLRTTEGLSIIVCEYEKSVATYIMSSIIDKLFHKYNSDIRFYQVDIQKNEQLQKDFSLNDFTILFFSNGDLVDYKSGIVSENELQAMILKLFNNSSQE